MSFACLSGGVCFTTTLMSRVSRGVLGPSTDLKIDRGAKDPIVASAPVPERFGTFAA